MPTPTPQDPLRPVSLTGKPLKALPTADDLRRASRTQFPLDSRIASQLESDEPEPTQKRRELAALLWGGPEEDIDIRMRTNPDQSVPTPLPLLLPKPAPPPATQPLSKNSLTPAPSPPPPTTAPFDPPPTTAPLAPATASFQPPPPQAAARTSGTGGRQSIRRMCSFPGMMRVLIPELSFEPRLFVVRIVDLSRGGARMETMQLTKELTETLKKERRHARLEILIPMRDKLIVTGEIVWIDWQENLSSLGFKFQKECLDVDEIFTPEGIGTSREVLILSSPQLDPFPSVTSLTSYAFSGRSPDAESIVVRLGSAQYETVLDPHSRFKITIPLGKNRPNFVSFTAIKECLSSIPTPVAITHQDAVENGTHTRKNIVETLEVSEDGERLSARLHGPANHFMLALKKLSESLEAAQELTLTVELKGNAKVAMEKLKALQKDEQK